MRAEDGRPETEDGSRETEDRRRKTEVKERPMLFGTPMVQGIQVGLKTQTRRTRGLELINLTPDIFQFNGSWKTINRLWDSTKEACPNPIKKFWVFEAPGHEDTVGGEEPGKIFVQCPYGKVGDLLWVRETWGITKDKYHRICFKAGDQAGNVCPVEKWRPSIHMPKAACRIWLEITDIRVERLRDITEEDAKAEGVESRFNGMFQETRYKDYSKATLWTDGVGIGHGEWRCPKSSFKSLWQSINGPGSWNANPWVWVVEFKKINK